MASEAACRTAFAHWFAQGSIPAMAPWDELYALQKALTAVASSLSDWFEQFPDLAKTANAFKLEVKLEACSPGAITMAAAQRLLCAANTICCMHVRVARSCHASNHAGSCQ